MINLNRIIGIRKYRIRLPPEDLIKEIENFLCPKHLIPGCKKWNISYQKETQYFEFTLNYEFQWIIRMIKDWDSKVDIKKMQKEFYKNMPDNIDYCRLNLRYNIPHQLRGLIIKINDFGCICQAECIPMLYEKISLGIISLEELSEFQVQDSQRESLNFLDRVFIGGLGAEQIQEAPLISHRLEILVNNTNKREITERIDSLLDDATGEVLICGWIGTHFIPKLKEIKSKGVNIRFITHKPQEAKGQPWRGDIEKAYGELCGEFGLENICIDPSMHGRMIIVDNKAIIGSMDLNSYSLTGAHTEFAIYTEEPEIVRRLRTQFNAKFKPLKEN